MALSATGCVALGILKVAFAKSSQRACLMSGRECRLNIPSCLSNCSECDVQCRSAAAIEHSNTNTTEKSYASVKRDDLHDRLLDLLDPQYVSVAHAAGGSAKRSIETLTTLPPPRSWYVVDGVSHPLGE